ncbi:sporulation initiation factor Spo0A C-terminal domain-containing protein [Zhenhengia yiwuensis]|uniref:sporulation initiation factor Spo0A C-terminal domain-containing protein n=1 Tax=Zhenhengia yiwuensis TaxID=2763666 RepID=UPI002A74A51A|nr:sporulation initiation factor Spo0A C-terminal domain-containing protein [Zhenhengia yiwuensis]MDY3368810.1 sporulation initiation factor Spo0A C-terminal domain-containing protein [Zhenhengia yiwuensis]
MIKKEEVKILLVDADFIWMEEVKVALEEDGFRKIKVCVDGEAAIREIAESEPDVVIVDQITTHKDGVAVIQHIRDSKLDIEVILTTRHTSDILLWKASSLDVQYIIVKPAAEEIIVARVNDIVLMKEKNTLPIEMDMESYDNSEELDDNPLMIIDEIGLESNIGRILMAFGIRAHLKGYKYLKTAIVMTIINEHVTSAMTRELYPQIARRFNTTDTSVERDMRHAIETAWSSAPIKHKKAYFGNQYLKAHADRKPTNSLFINTIAEKLRQNLKGQIALMSI